MKLSVFYEHIVEASEQSSKSIAKICREIYSHGITGIEIEDKRLLSNKDEIIKILKEADMEISCIYAFFDFSHKNELSRAFELIDLAQDLKVLKVMIIPGFIQKKHEKIFFIYDRLIQRMIHSLTAVSGYAKDKKVMLLLEDFDDKIAPFATAKQLKYFIDHVPDLYCAFDTGNFLYSEEDSLEVLPLFIDKIRHVHCKDRTFEREEGETPKRTVRGRDMYSCSVGSGCIKMKEIIEKVIENGYDGYFAIEHFGSLNQLEDMKKSAVWLTEF